MPDSVPAKSSRTTYKRELPSPPAVAFSSALGKRYLAEALADGTAESFFRLIEQFHTQDEPAFCGLASIAMVLNALQVDPKRIWKGPWRWFHEQMLDCCKPIDDIIKEGITLEQAACIARCNGARTQLIRGSEISLPDFEEMIKDASSHSGQLLIVSYTRRTFLQTGDGHFSPVGGYHAASNSVLILDVARFKYCPHWVPVSLLFEAMKPVDPLTGKSRGFLSLQTRIQASSVLFSLNIASRCIQEAMALLDTFDKYADSALSEEDLANVVDQLVPLSSFIQARTGDGKCHGCGECIQKEAVKQLLQEIHDIQLFAMVTKALDKAHRNSDHESSFLAEKICLSILLGATVQLNPGGNTVEEKQVRQSFQLDEYHQILQAEVAYIQSQIRELPNLQEVFEMSSTLGCGCKNATCCCGPAA